MECLDARNFSAAIRFAVDIMFQTLDVQSAVGARYSEAARQFEPQLCCAVSYDARYLKAIPAEIIERDYGCGNPAEFVRAGETVLDLGSGGGKICYIASQIVGASGRVIGVDINDEMLALAEKYRAQIGVEVPQTMRDDAELWSGCISGVYQESAFVQAFEDAGFSDVKIVKRDEKLMRCKIAAKGSVNLR